MDSYRTRRRHGLLRLYNTPVRHILCDIAPEVTGAFKDARGTETDHTSFGSALKISFDSVDT